MNLTHLFGVERQTKGGLGPVVPAENREGGVLGRWEGELDEETSTARYRVQAQAGALEAARLVVAGVERGGVA